MFILVTAITPDHNKIPHILPVNRILSVQRGMFDEAAIIFTKDADPLTTDHTVEEVLDLLADIGFALPRKLKVEGDN